MTQQKSTSWKVLETVLSQLKYIVNRCKIIDNRPRENVQYMYLSVASNMIT